MMMMANKEVACTMRLIEFVHNNDCMINTDVITHF